MNYEDDEDHYFDDVENAEEDENDDPIWDNPNDDGEFEQPEPPDSDLIHEW